MKTKPKSNKGAVETGSYKSLAEYKSDVKNLITEDPQFISKFLASGNRTAKKAFLINSLKMTTTISDHMYYKYKAQIDIIFNDDQIKFPGCDSEVDVTNEPDNPTHEGPLSPNTDDENNPTIPAPVEPLPLNTDDKNEPSNPTPEEPVPLNTDDKNEPSNPTPEELVPLNTDDKNNPTIPAPEEPVPLNTDDENNPTIPAPEEPIPLNTDDENKSTNSTPEERVPLNTDDENKHIPPKHDESEAIKLDNKHNSDSSKKDNLDSSNKDDIKIIRKSNKLIVEITQERLEENSPLIHSDLDDITPLKEEIAKLKNNKENLLLENKSLESKLNELESKIRSTKVPPNDIRIIPETNFRIQALNNLLSTKPQIIDVKINQYLLLKVAEIIQQSNIFSLTDALANHGDLNSALVQTALLLLISQNFSE